jgi:hypothetical protein
MAISEEEIRRWREQQENPKKENKAPGLKFPKEDDGQEKKDNIFPPDDALRKSLGL